MATKTIKMAISPSITARIQAFKDSHKHNWIRGIIQRICFVPPRPVRAVPLTAVPYQHGRSTRLAYQGLYREWRDNFKANRPIVYWLTETVPSYVNRAIEVFDNKWYDVTDWCDNYFIQRADRFLTGIKRGDGGEADELMLYANFNQLKDFVETVFSARYLRTMVHKTRKENPEEEKKWIKLDNKARRYPLLHFKRYRSVDYALRYLHMQMELPTDEYDGPDEIRRLGLILCMYIWWTQVRPNRGDSEEVSGLKFFRDSMTAQYGEEERWLYSRLTLVEQEEYRELMHKDDALEAEWLQEDTDMLVKLVKERHNLWI